MKTIDAVFEVIQALRGENGCPWDQKQTPESMWKCLAEEVYELQEAIAKEDEAHACEELGDVLFQLIFIVELFQEKKAFTLSRIIEQVNQKMILRHPHVFSDARVANESELNRQWDEIKAGEKTKLHRKNGSVMDRVPKGMPSLMRALNVSKCAVKEGFDWDDIHGVLGTVRDEIDEFEAALAKNDPKEMNLEFGDILFSLVNVARFAKIYPESALADSTAKFEGRFRLMEALLKQDSKKLDELPRDQVDQLWEQAKADYDR